MLYRRMPRNGDELSILGFGCMRLQVKEKRSLSRAIGQIRYAIDRGVNYVDTAWPYHAGESETVLEKACRRLPGPGKDGHQAPSWMIQSRADMDRFLAAQLVKLGTEQIDYYLVHRSTESCGTTSSDSASATSSNRR